MIPIIAAIMTALPMILFNIQIPFTLNLLLTLSIKYVRTNHHNKAPNAMDRYPMDCWNRWSGITNVKRANNATNKNIINGLEKVTKNPVTIL